MDLSKKKNSPRTTPPPGDRSSFQNQVSKTPSSTKVKKIN